MDELWLTLVLRAGVTAAIVIAAALIAERVGPLWGGLVASLPVSAGPAFVMLAMEQDSAFVAAAALGAVIANPATVAFGVVIVRLLPRLGVWIALPLALAVWCALVVATRWPDWSTAAVIATTALAHGAGYLLTRGRTGLAAGGARPLRRAWYDLPLRAALVGLLVAVVVTMSTTLGPVVSGVFAVAPVTYTSLVLVVAARQGREAGAAIMAGALRGFVGFAMGFVALHLLAVKLGSASALLVGLLVMLAWSAGILALRRRRA